MMPQMVGRRTISRDKLRASQVIQLGTQLVAVPRDLPAEVTMANKECSRVAVLVAVPVEVPVEVLVNLKHSPNMLMAETSACRALLITVFRRFIVTALQNTGLAR